MTDRNNSTNTPCIDLLWTGGWDSTFRLLQILLDEKKKVRPHYLIDHGRPSIGKEILAMNLIKKAVCERYPHAIELLLPTEYRNIQDIASDAEITGCYKEIIKTRHLGSQYDWMARYCKENGISKMELGFERGAGDGKSKKDASNITAKITSGNYGGKPRYDFMSLMLPREVEGRTIFCFDETLCTKDEFTIFKYFGTCISDVNKVEIKKIAEERGFIDIMNLTWFCHRPLFGKIPCGLCNPCTDALQKGMHHRIPLLGKLFNVVVTTFRLRKLKQALFSKPKS